MTPSSTKSWLESVAEWKRNGAKFDPGSKRALNCWDYSKRAKRRSTVSSAGSASATSNKASGPTGGKP